MTRSSARSSAAPRTSIRPAGAGRAWVIDPIDGTKSYVRGMDTWTTLIALLEDGEVKLGVVSMPALDKRWWAVRGQGAFADGRRSTCQDRRARHRAVPLERDRGVGCDRRLRAGRRPRPRAAGARRGVGDAWQYMLVAEGAAEIATDPEATLWDLAAVSIVVEEAGGRFTARRGRGPGPAAASPPTACCMRGARRIMQSSADALRCVGDARTSA